MTTFILLLWISTHGLDGFQTATTFSAEFNSKKACESAAKAFVDEFGEVDQVHVCVPKG